MQMRLELSMLGCAKLLMLFSTQSVEFGEPTRCGVVQYFSGHRVPSVTLEAGCCWLVSLLFRAAVPPWPTNELRIARRSGTSSTKYEELVLILLEPTLPFYKLTGTTMSINYSGRSLERSAIFTGIAACKKCSSLLISLLEIVPSKDDCFLTVSRSRIPFLLCRVHNVVAKFR